MKKNQEYIGTFAMIFIVAVMTAVPLLWRSLIGNAFPPGNHYYELSTITEQLRAHDFTALASYPYPLYSALIALLGPGFLIPLSIAAGIFAVLILYLILRNEHLDESSSLFITSIWALSFSFISMIYLDGRKLFVILLFLLAILSIQKNKSWMSILLMFASGLISTVGTAGSLLCLAMYLAWKKRTWQELLPPATAALVAIVASWILAWLAGPITPLRFGNIQLIQEFGVIGGISIVTFCLGYSGAILLWDREYKIVYLLGAALSVATIWIPQWLPYLALLLTIVSAYMFLVIIKQEWTSRLFSITFIVAYLIGISFSAVAAMHEIAVMEPRQEQEASLFALSELPNGITLSAAKYGDLLETTSNKTAFINERSLASELNISTQIFQSTKLVNATTLLHEQNISYIYITTPMKNGQIWNTTQQGLLLLLQDEASFSRYYKDDFAEIYIVLT